MLEVPLTIIDPATVDWSREDDSTVWHAAQGGIPQAQVELWKRESAYRAAFGDPEDSHGHPTR